MKQVAIRTEYIQLGQFLKLAGCVSTGGEAKVLLQENKVTVNGEPEARRGRKLYNGDQVALGEDLFLVCEASRA